ncbi:MAG: hypothetical protein MJZ76_02525 [Bacteroidales bacterium]|nr:hypothetical protein [Bacteroidales bacterium]
MKKYIFLIISLIFCIQTAFSQIEQIPLPKSLRTSKETTIGKERKVKIQLGGNFGLSFGSVINVAVSPHVGICPVKWLSIGVGGYYSYQYYKYHQLSSLNSKGSHTFGVSGYIEAYPWNRLIIHASYEYLNYAAQYYDPISYNYLYTDRVGTHAILAGIGYKQAISDRLSVYSLILFNLNQDKYSIYSNPLIRVGVNFDL